MCRRLAPLLLAALPSLGVADVSCGGHRASDCQKCTKGAPRGQSQAFCNGDCEWKQNRCLKREEKKPGADYYATLGVERNVDDVKLKSAYRKMSLEWHPDKCTEEKDVCQAKFIEVSTAYEVLSDKEKRKIYDKHGEEGLKEQGQQGGDGNAEAMFTRFFGRAPNGKVRIVNQGGRMMFFEDEEEGPTENLYDDSDVVELTDTVWSHFIGNRDEPWLVLFYKPNDDECVSLVDEYKQVGKTFNDIVKIAAVNCRKEGQVCSQNSIKSFPAVRWYTEDNTKDPEVFEGLVNAKLLGKFVSSSMPDYSTKIAEKRPFREWVDQQTTATVVLFTDKKEVPPLWKALSREYKNRISLGTVLRCDKHGVFKNEMQQVFDVRIPGVVRIDPLGATGSIADKFDMEFKKEKLQLWFMKTIAVSKKEGPKATFKEWSKDRLEAGDCGPKDSQFCFLWLKAGADKQVEEAMRSLAMKYRTDPIKMMWTSVELHPGMLDAFGLENSDASDHFVAYRSKRGKFKVHEGALRFEELDAFVDSTINGPPLTGKVKIEHIEL